MRKAKRTILIAMLICVVTVPVCSAQTNRGATKSRVIHFPKDRSLGILMIEDAEQMSTSPFGFALEGIKWERFGQAVGEVRVPHRKRLQLILNSWTWQKPDNLSVLRQLKPDDIYSLTLSPEYSPGNRRPSNRCMPYVAHLTGLKTLNLWGGEYYQRRSEVHYSIQGT
jgi:hypothetical protein